MRRCIPLLTLLMLPSPLHAQITRDNYYPYVPTMSKIVEQTTASDALHLYGDAASPSYTDDDSNGIDDVRQKQLHRIADRFSPILRRNNFSFPRNFKTVYKDDAALFVDIWTAGKRSASQDIKLGWRPDVTAGADGDSILRWLLGDVDPSGSERRSVKPNNYNERIMFVDFPGHDPKTWREAYIHAPQKDATIYTHFFIHEDTSAYGTRRYFLVAQNWFFYPFDDAANNHEGDWEHMNVLITTRSAAQTDLSGGMTELEMEAVLSGEADKVRSLVIAYVDYYFHENVYTLSYLHAYSDPTVSPATEPWIRRQAIWREPGYVNGMVNARMAAAGGALATHAIGFIGGNNKGPDELFSVWPRFKNAFNRNGHGTYAFPGTWQSVGAMASTEQIAGRAIPALRSGGSDTDAICKRIADPMFVAFCGDNVVVVPDWERVNGLFATRGRARGDWGWLILPMRWGFPASLSPGAGALAHTDVGNISPEGPAYQPTWNRVGSAFGWREYQPEVLNVMLAPTTPWDKLKSGWGILNVPVATIGFLPGWNVVFTQLMPWWSGTMHVFGAPPARTFRPEKLDVRFSTMTAAMQHQRGGREFALLLPTPESLPNTSDATLSQHSANAMQIGLQIYYGPRLSVDNTYVRSDRTITAAHANDGGSVLANVSGLIHTQDITSGFRYDLLQSELSNFHLFVRGGWGWTWYKVDNVTMDGASAPDSAKGGYRVTILPSKRWWPNTWYTGGGVEYFAQHGLLGQLGYGLRAEFGTSRHRLGAENPGDPTKGTARRSDVSLAAVIGW